MENTFPACSIELTLSLIGDKWKFLIVRDLLTGTKRFGELKRSLGSISQKVLTSQLRLLEQNGIVHREVFAQVPPRVEYSLTTTGKTLSSVLSALESWGDEYRKNTAQQ